MASTEGPRRRRGKKSKAKKKKDAPATTVADLPDHVFGRILLRLGPHDTACLVRAAAMCRRWRAVVADAGFLARFRSVHAPLPHVGDYRHVVGPVFVPKLPAVGGLRFSLDFLQDTAPGSWEVADSRGSLLLLSKNMTHRTPWSRCRCSPHLIVCQPITRRYQGILWPPHLDGHRRLGLFLVDGGGMSNFRVLAAADKTLACVFSAGSDGGWRLVGSAATSTSGVNLSSILGPGDFVGRANGVAYWGMEGNASAMLALDEATAKFSITVIPQDVWGPSYIRSARVIGSEDGVLRIVRLANNHFKVFARRHPSSGNGEWVLEKVVSLPEETIGLPGREESFFQQEAMIVAANARFVLLTPSVKRWFFSIELDTMCVENEHERNKYAGAAFPYELPWPPVLRLTT